MASTQVSTLKLYGATTDPTAVDNAEYVNTTINAVRVGFHDGSTSYWASVGPGGFYYVPSGMVEYIPSYRVVLWGNQTTIDGQVIIDGILTHI